MKTATKATLNRLIKMDTRASRLLKEYVEEANNVEDLINDGFCGFEYNAIYTSYGMYLRVNNDYDKATLRGLHTRFESLVGCTLTHGLNECQIYDINKLVRKMLNSAP